VVVQGMCRSEERERERETEEERVVVCEESGSERESCFSL